MDKDEYLDIEASFTMAGMPTYEELLESLHDIIRDPGTETKEEHNARVLKAVLTARERYHRAVIKRKLNEINSEIIKARMRKGGGE